MIEDEMVGWHHRLNGRKFEQVLGDNEGQESLVCCHLWGHEQLDMTEHLNNNSRLEGPAALECLKMWFQESREILFAHMEKEE